MERRTVTEAVRSAARGTLRLLKQHEHFSSAELAHRLGVSRETLKRAVEWLRDRGARVEYVARARAMRLENRDFALPLLDPTVEDLQAALTAAGLLDALGQEQPAERAWALFAELETILFETRGRQIRRDALRVTQTSARLRVPEWMLTLLRAARREVLRVSYRSPWTNELKQHVFEPWQVALHDGALYVRGHSRARGAARTLNVAHIVDLRVAAGERPRARPPGIALWGEEDPSLGIDLDRPGIAVLTFHGAVARWVSGITWHPEQRDEWASDASTLTRTLPFRSCREFARRVASVADGLVALEPPALVVELESVLRVGLVALEKTIR